MRHAITGLIVAHNVGVAHRDVSLENMVVKDRENMLTTPLTIIGKFVFCEEKIYNNNVC